MDLTWGDVLENEQISAAQEEGRRLARMGYENSFESRYYGQIDGICAAADFFISKDRLDIAQHLLAHFSIDRQKAKSALREKEEREQKILERLDKAGAWDKPPILMPVIR
jgi:hypothetical protein